MTTILFSVVALALLCFIDAQRTKINLLQRRFDYQQTHCQALGKSHAQLVKYLGLEYFEQDAHAEGYKKKTENSPITISPLPGYLPAENSKKR